MKIESNIKLFFLHFGSKIASFKEKNRLTFEKWKKSSFFEEFKTPSKKISIPEGPEKKSFWQKKFHGALVHGKT